ncbi:hypothetical protein [Pseudodesulfovibrio pelocollis]|uniref:hypothetical protein n=1 Tax=Pseudodesulfovibrio pelocollis TaxID=3051432 RepID=UPI00255B2F74|nr:hypothetical protein [Pseudodesulfovibrio sp. SB368]
MITRVANQPGPLRGVHYRRFPVDAYKWFEMVAGGEVYAVCGVTVAGDEAWIYWRILRPGPVAWRELKRVDVPWLREFCRNAGAVNAYVSSDDPGDVNFDKMVGLMGFHVVKFGCQSLVEDNHVR